MQNKSSSMTGFLLVAGAAAGIGGCFTILM
jgi:hypothetical protein